MKKQILAALLSLGAISLFAADTPPDAKQVCPMPPEAKEMMKKTSPEHKAKMEAMKKHREEMQQKMRADREKARTLVKQYKENPTEENKAALKKFCTEQFDFHQKMAKERLDSMKKELTKMEQRVAEADKNKEKFIEERMGKMLRDKPCPAPGEKRNHGKNAPGKQEKKPRPAPEAPENQE